MGGDDRPNISSDEEIELSSDGESDLDEPTVEPDAESETDAETETDAESETDAETEADAETYGNKFIVDAEPGTFAEPEPAEQKHKNPFIEEVDAESVDVEPGTNAETYGSGFIVDANDTFAETYGSGFIVDANDIFAESTHIDAEPAGPEHKNPFIEEVDANDIFVEPAEPEPVGVEPTGAEHTNIEFAEPEPMDVQLPETKSSVLRELDRTADIEIVNKTDNITGSAEYTESVEVENPTVEVEYTESVEPFIEEDIQLPGLDKSSELAAKRHIKILNTELKETDGGNIIGADALGELTGAGDTLYSELVGIIESTSADLVPF
jgi:hypothetical protein